MAQNYSVRYKGEIEEYTAHRLVELSRQGQLSGVHEYYDGQVWTPVNRMEYERDGLDWRIKDSMLNAVTPVAPARGPAAEAAPVPPPSAPTMPPMSSPTVVQHIHSAPAPGVVSTPGIPASSSALGILAIAGFTFSTVGLLGVLAVPVFWAIRGRIESPIIMAAAVFAVLGVVLGACTIANPARRGFAVAGLSVGLVATFACAVLLVLMFARPELRTGFALPPDDVVMCLIARSHLR
ncbi:MAG: hypothetical protein K2W85_12030 [Phycisphaerales bacterium]|nr:hypothetical protein [Phycisphaerales bacterium]